MTREEIEQKTSLCFLLNPNIPEEEKICVIEKVMATKATIVSKVALCNIITYILKQNAELEEKIGVLLSCKNCPENKGGWICAKEYEDKCLAQKIEFIKELEKEKCELLGIIQGKDKVIQELEKEIAELDCQKNRNKACYSCASASERCFKNEIGCPCEKYKSYKDENAELKGIKDIATLIRANNNTVITLMQLNNMLVSKNQQLNKAKELLTKWVELFKPKGGNIPLTPIQVETEQFIREVEK